MIIIIIIIIIIITHSLYSAIAHKNVWAPLPSSWLVDDKVPWKWQVVLSPRFGA